MEYSKYPHRINLSGILSGILLTLATTTSAKTNTTVPAAPLAFMENKGQVTDQNFRSRNDIQYAVHTSGNLNIFIEAGALHYQFEKPSAKNTYQLYRMDVTLAGANPGALCTPMQQQEYTEHYYTTGTGEKGALVHGFGKLVYKDVYPNIDWVLYSGNGTLKHEFVVHRGGRVSDIRMQYGGADVLAISSTGALAAKTPLGDITEHAPDTYDADGKRIASSFVIEGNEVHYAVDGYQDEITIDPQLEWATYFGGPQKEGSKAVALDNLGANVYMSGYTNSVMNVATSGAFQQTIAGNNDAFLVKLSSTGVRQWATYMGAPGDDVATGVAASNYGIAITGYTNSDTSLSSIWSSQYVKAGGTDAFVASFDVNGGRLWSTYYGGTGDDTAWSAASDAWGNIFVCGSTTSATGMSAGLGFQMTSGGGTDAFVAKFSSAGSPLWGTYYGGGGEDEATSVRVDNFGNVVFGGTTTSGSGIASVGAFQTTLSGLSDAFVAKFSNSGAQLWATYYGGTEYEDGVAGVDGYSNVLLAGSTFSTAGIATTGAWKTTYDTLADVFVVKFDQGGTRQWATYYGGHNTDVALAVNGDAVGNVYVTGTTKSLTNISWGSPLQGSPSGEYDGFLGKFTPAGTMQYATYYAGSLDDDVADVVCDNTGHLYMAGTTRSPTGIATGTGHQGTLNGLSDAFLVKFKDMWSTEVTTLPSGRVLSVYPNPAQGVFHVVTANAGRLDLYAADGKCVANYTLKSGDNDVAAPVWLAPGLYSGHFSDSDGNTAAMKVMLSR